MSEPSFHESVVAADKRSKAIALLVAIGLFLAVNRIVGDVQFASIVAATAGIGTRLYVPYHASMRVPAADRTPLSEHPATGEYHHGAAGLALVTVSLAAIVVFGFGHGLITAVGVGVISGSVAYVMLSSALPSE
ncbi:hypothetical protein [Halorubrum halodurans]|uniref:Uncharacterized protein n=1 Tax=Halorubrum halodurans TaxID=1383851 RepID=A0A256IRL4_9EURY|nr:hypothetical protein [Halorubrum halodurans]OYR58777.1 hypothetical protein DJ70_02105 [Halorubrum halodurans]